MNWYWRVPSSALLLLSVDSKTLQHISDKQQLKVFTTFICWTYLTLKQNTKGTNNVSKSNNNPSLFYLTRKKSQSELSWSLCVEVVTHVVIAITVNILCSPNKNPSELPSTSSGSILDEAFVQAFIQGLANGLSTHCKQEPKSWQCFKNEKRGRIKRTHWIVQVTIQMLMLFDGFLDMENRYFQTRN